MRLGGWTCSEKDSWWNVNLYEVFILCWGLLLFTRSRYFNFYRTISRLGWSRKPLLPLQLNSPYIILVAHPETFQLKALLLLFYNWLWTGAKCRIIDVPVQDTSPMCHGNNASGTTPCCFVDASCNLQREKGAWVFFICSTPCVLHQLAVLLWRRLGNCVKSGTLTLDNVPACPWLCSLH